MFSQIVIWLASFYFVVVILHILFGLLMLYVENYMFGKEIIPYVGDNGCVEEYVSDVKTEIIGYLALIVFTSLFWIGFLNKDGLEYYTYNLGLISKYVKYKIGGKL